MTIQVKSAPTPREIADRAWMEAGSCRGVDTDPWFDSKPPRYVRRHIEKVCSSCPVTRLCLSYALVNNEEFGAWGGYTMGQLQPLQRLFASGETLSRVLDLGIPEPAFSRGSDAA